MVSCYFCIDGENSGIAFKPQQMIPPRIGEMLFIEGKRETFKVVDVQYQFSDGGMLKIVNVIAKLCKGA